MRLLIKANPFVSLGCRRKCRKYAPNQCIWQLAVGGEWYTDVDFEPNPERNVKGVVQPSVAWNAPTKRPVSVKPLAQTPALDG
jgi:hypothetical protein